MSVFNRLCNCLRGVDMCKGTVAFLSDPPLKGKTHTNTLIQIHTNRAYRNTQTCSLRLPSRPLLSSIFLNNSGPEWSPPPPTKGLGLNWLDLASDPGEATRPLGGSLQCILGESIVKAKHFLWSRSSSATITFHIFVWRLRSATLRSGVNRHARAHSCS